MRGREGLATQPPGGWCRWSPQTLPDPGLPRVKGTSPSPAFLCGIHQEGRPAHDATAGRDGATVAAAGTGSWPPTQCTSDIPHAELTPAYAFPQRAPTWRACVYTHARRARTGYSRACTHSKGTEVLHVHTHTAHNLYVYMYAHTQRTTQRPRLGLKEGRPSGWMLASQLFLSSVKQPGHHPNLHFPLCPALHLSTFSQPAWLPSFPPGSWHQR